MSASCFVDTNILVYAHDLAGGDKHQRAKACVEQLWDSRAGVISTQILQELAVNLRRKATRPPSARALRDLIADYRAWTVIVNGPEAILHALDLESQYRVSFWDALVIVAAQASGAAILYSEDLADGQHYGSVQVLNPLRP